MLYITTRGDKDAFTSHRALIGDIAPDGGRYVPFQLPCYDKTEIAALQEKPFGQTVAEILNMFFSCRLTGWDVDFCIGRNTTRLTPMSHRILVAELWHCPEANYSAMVKNLSNKITDGQGKVSDWMTIAVQIAMLFGIYGQMLRTETVSRDQKFDVSVTAGDFSEPMVAWYARKMGLPIGMIVCTCDEDGSVWDLIHKGVFNTAAADTKLQLGVERLIQGTLGFAEVHRYREKCENKNMYSLDEEQLPVLNTGMFCAVAGKNRAETIINSVFRSNAYILDPVTALCCGGLQDYRAKTGNSGLTLLLAGQTPMDFTQEITKATGISADALKDHINMT